MSSSTTRRPTAPAVPTPAPWRRQLGALLIGTAAAVLGSAVWAGAAYLAGHVSVHWR